MTKVISIDAFGGDNAPLCNLQGAADAIKACGVTVTLVGDEEKIKSCAKENNISDEALYKTLSYFDVKNFTDKIQCPVLMAIGLQDPVCPPHTNFAGYNHIKTEKSWICYPLAGHNVWQQEGWPQAKQQFLDTYIIKK